MNNSHDMQDSFVEGLMDNSCRSRRGHLLGQGAIRLDLGDLVRRRTADATPRWNTRSWSHACQTGTIERSRKERSFLVADQIDVLGRCDIIMSVNECFGFAMSVSVETPSLTDRVSEEWVIVGQEKPQGRGEDRSFRGPDS